MSIGAILFIVVMLVSTINEVVTKRRKGQSTPGAPPRPGPGGRTLPRSGTRSTGAGTQPDTADRVPQRPAEDTAQQSAQVLLPDDLWAILTGEHRPAPPMPEPEPEPEVWEPEPELEVWEPEPWERPDAQADASRPVAAGEWGREDDHSLEAVVPSDEERHDAFHRRLEATAPATLTAPSRRGRAARRHQLRRAIMLREVLGPPRGLEDPF
jgi:hypothetical protein